MKTICITLQLCFCYVISCDTNILHQSMEIGLHGVHGQHVAQHVEKEHRKGREHAQILPKVMVAMIAMENHLKIEIANLLIVQVQLYITYFLSPPLQGLVKGTELSLNPYFFGWLEK